MAGLLRAINKRRCQHPPLDPRPSSPLCPSLFFHLLHVFCPLSSLHSLEIFFSSPSLWHTRPPSRKFTAIRCCLIRSFCRYFSPFRSAWILLRTSSSHHCYLQTLNFTLCFPLDRSHAYLSLSLCLSRLLPLSAFLIFSLLLVSLFFLHTVPLSRLSSILFSPRISLSIFVVDPSLEFHGFRTPSSSLVRRFHSCTFPLELLRLGTFLFCCLSRNIRFISIFVAGNYFSSIKERKGCAMHFRCALPSFYFCAMHSCAELHTLICYYFPYSFDSQIILASFLRLFS